VSVPLLDLPSKEAKALQQKLSQVPGVLAVIPEPKLSRLRVKTKLGEVSRQSLSHAVGTLAAPLPPPRTLLIAPELSDPGQAALLAASLKKVPGVVRADANSCTGLALALGDASPEALKAAALAAGVRAVERGGAAPPRSSVETLGAMFGLMSLMAALFGNLLGGVAARSVLAGAALLCVAGGAWFSPRRSDFLRWLAALGALLAAFLLDEAGLLPEVAAAVALGTVIERGLVRQQRAQSSEPLLGLIARFPSKARVETAKDGNTLLREVELPSPGDVLVVREGERIPADGPVIRGRAELDDDEVLPAGSLRAGDYALTGQKIRSGEVSLRAVAFGEDSFLGRLILRSEEARAEHLAGAPLDGAAPVLLLGAALLVGLGAFLLGGGIAGALSAALLVVAALPASALRGADDALSAESVSRVTARGLLVGRLSALEKAASVQDVLVDRSGALLRRETRVGEIVTLYDLPEEHIVRYAAAASVGVPHPVAEALVEYARSTDVSLPEVDMQDAAPGEGVTASVLGKAVYVGSAELMSENNISVEALSEETALMEGAARDVVFVAIDRRLVGALSIEDTPRRGAKAAMEDLQKAGLRSILVTGSEGGAGRALSQALGVAETKTGVEAHKRPWEAEQLREEGRTVAALGDSEEDAPMLAAADVSIGLRSLGDGAGSSFESAGTSPGAALQVITAGREWLRARQAARLGVLGFWGALLVVVAFGLLPAPLVVLAGAFARSGAVSLGRLAYPASPRAA
jgi:Cu+-exporting ATPase